jgi:hypothetical protein
MKRLSETYNAKSFPERYDTLPGRIMLDTNVVQYLLDFGEFIFEGYVEGDDGFVTPRGRVIRPDSRLFEEIEALHRIFVRINNAQFEFAVCGQTLVELSDRSDPERRSAMRWFYDLLDHWEAVVEAYGRSFPAAAAERYWRARADPYLANNVQKKDRNVVLEAIRFDCRAVLTVDRLATPATQRHFFDRYQLMILWPSDFISMLAPFQALYNG